MLTYWKYRYVSASLYAIATISALCFLGRPRYNREIEFLTGFSITTHDTWSGWPVVLHRTMVETTDYSETVSKYETVDPLAVIAWLANIVNAIVAILGGGYYMWRTDLLRRITVRSLFVLQAMVAIYFVVVSCGGNVSSNQLLHTQAKIDYFTAIAILVVAFSYAIIVVAWVEVICERIIRLQAWLTKSASSPLKNF